MIAADPRVGATPWFSVILVPAREEVWLQAIGELDLAAAPTLRESVQELLAVGFQRLVIDLRRITFIDLIGVKLLLDLTHDASDDGWQLSLIHGDGQPRRMLKLIGALDQPLPGTDHRDV